MSRNTAIIAAFTALIVSAGALSAAEIFVDVNPDNTFSPANITINVGDTVTWTNQGGLHNVEAVDGSFRCANGCDGDGMGGNGDPATNPWVASVTFTEVDEIDYFCIVHLGIGMVGSINVVDAGSGPNLDIIGNSCPGNIVMNITGATPNSGVAIIGGPSMGNTNVPAGSCAGTPLDLASPNLLTIVNANGAGEITINRTLNANNCGLFLQVLDIATCSTSNVFQLP